MNFQKSVPATERIHTLVCRRLIRVIVGRITNILGASKVSEDSITELPHITFQRCRTELESHEEISIDIGGPTLEECRKHFDEILRGEYK